MYFRTGAMYTYKLNAANAALLFVLVVVIFPPFPPPLLVGLNARMVSNSPAAKTSDANCADRVLVNLDDGAIDDDVLVIIVLETNVLVDVATPRAAAAVVVLLAVSVRIDFTDEHEKC